MQQEPHVTQPCCASPFAASSPLEVRARRKELGVIPSMKRVDTCAAEFEAATPYMYSSYDGNCECEPTTERKVRWQLLLLQSWYSAGSCCR
jgi:hypothetical protein